MQWVKSQHLAWEIYTFFSQTEGVLGFCLIRVLQHREKLEGEERDPQARVSGPSGEALLSWLVLVSRFRLPTVAALMLGSSRSSRKPRGRCQAGVG